jgi:hypothetical protein
LLAAHAERIDSDANHFNVLRDHHSDVFCAW